MLDTPSTFLANATKSAIFLNLSLSTRSLTDLRLWILNSLRDGVDLNTFPQAEKVFSWAKQTMLPPGVKVEESAATAPLQSIVTTTIVR